MKSLIISLLLLALAPVIARSQSGNDWLERARNAYKKAQFDSVLFFIDQSPEKATYGALLLKGDAYQKQEIYDLAISNYNQAERLNKKDSQLYIHRGSANIWSGMLDKAESDLERARTLNTDDAQLYYYLGILNYYKYKTKAAVKALDACIDLEPGYAPAYYLRGACYGEMGRYNQSIADYSKAYDLDSTLTIALYNIAVVKYLDKDFYSAQQDFGQLLESDLQNKSLIHYYKAECAYYLNDKQEACKAYKDAGNLGDEMSQEIYDKYCLKGAQRKDLPRRESQSISL